MKWDKHAYCILWISSTRNKYFQVGVVLLIAR